MSITRPAVYDLPVDLHRLLKDIERHYYAAALDDAAANAAAAARLLGAHEHTARNAMVRLGLRVRDHRP